MPETQKQSRYSVDCHDIVHLVEFCPFEWSCQLIAIGTETRVTVGSCRFQEEDAEVDGVEFDALRDFHHGSRITTIAWSPETSLLTVPKVLRFCTGAADKKVRLHTSDLKTEDKVEVLGEHRDYVNGLCFQPDKGEYIASVSDDHTCRVWGVDGVQAACFPLGAPGMSVCWHNDEPGKVMVAEKKGIIRFYNVFTQQPIMSLDCGHMPVISANWCHSNPLRVAAVSGTDWFVFDTSRSSRPLENKQAHMEGAHLVRWCRSHDHLLATTGRPGSQLRVFSMRSSQAVLATDLKIAGGLSWHHRLPIVAVGGDKKVHFWVIEVL